MQEHRIQRRRSGPLRRTVAAARPSRRVQLRRDRLAQEGEQLLVGHRRREAGGAAVPAAALGAGDHRHVDVVVGGPQGDFVLALALAVGELAHERRDLRALAARAAGR